MISQSVEYSLRAMVLLTQSAGQPLTVQAMAADAQIPAPYLAKLLQGLTRAGLVRSQRGIHGGFVLTHHPAKITLADIVNVIEPLQRITKCPLGISGHGTLCPLHQRLDQAFEMVEQSFQKKTLDELFKESRGADPLCRSQSIVSLNLAFPRPGPDC